MHESFYSAVFDRNHAEIDRLLASGFDPNAIMPEEVHPAEGFSYFSFSAMLGDTQALEIFIRHGVDVNGRLLERGSSPLIEAVFYGVYDSAKFLIEHGADVNYRDDVGASAMDWLFMHRHTDSNPDMASPNVNIRLFDLLVDSGADIQSKDTIQLLSLVILNEDNYFPEYKGILRMLLENGLDINAMDSGNTALLGLVSKKLSSEIDLDLLNLCIDHGYDVELKNNEGNSLLDFLDDETTEFVKACLENKRINDSIYTNDYPHVTIGF